MSRPKMTALSESLRKANYPWPKVSPVSVLCFFAFFVVVYMK